jgi:hypothetical protein
LFAIWLLGQKTALFCHFFTFFQLRSTTMRLQKAKKLAKNSSILPQTPNRKQALTKMQRGGSFCRIFAPRF